jgi:L-2-hydroxyglutarate oxidase
MFDFCVIGGGIVGLATALELLKRRPGANLLLLEKEDCVGVHQTGHNSGVIHAGIYYAPGSLKAKLCKAGLTATMEFCKEYDIPFEQCGKLIVATNTAEEQRIGALYDRAVANGLQLERLGQTQLRDLEPNVAGTAALLSPATGMVDYRAVVAKMAELLGKAGATIRLGTPVTSIVEDITAVEVGSSAQSWRAKHLVVCGGLQSDRLAQMAGLAADFRIVPFRGEYYRLPASMNAIVKHHIYPAPDPDLPFLGVHLTRMIDGGITVGPNAVLGLAREGYPKGSFELRDAAETLGYVGLWKLIAKNLSHSLHELKGSLFKGAYLEDCRKYCPSLRIEDLLPYRAGIRAQVVTNAGVAVHDFLFKRTERMLHVCNAPSPAATSAIPIAEMITTQIIGGANSASSA